MNYIPKRKTNYPKPLKPDAEEKLALRLLAHFRIPVLITALQMQPHDLKYPKLLAALLELTLLEQHIDLENADLVLSLLCWSHGCSNIVNFPLSDAFLTSFIVIFLALLVVYWLLFVEYLISNSSLTSSDSAELNLTNLSSLGALP